MGVVASLLKQVPAAAKFRSKLEALENEVVQLRAENARLASELDQYLEQWETLDGPAVSTLAYLSDREHGHAAEIARDIAANIQIVESSLTFLLKGQYVAPAGGSAKTVHGKKARFSIAPKGARYLRSRGLHRGA